MGARTEIVKSGKCGNSPKNAFVEDFAIWLMTADKGNLTASLSPDGAFWANENQPLIERLSNIQPIKITIFDAISHGRVGAARGELITPGGHREFSVFLEFQNTKAERVNSAKVFFAPFGERG